MQQQRELSNGLRVELISDPQATRASALLQVAVGSHHEPDVWPGLAHLLEHLLFSGSEGFQQQERLMAWLPAQGGRLNATTLGSSTAYFFECAPEQLAQALARLTDMLVAPLLSAEAIRQEVATIDAECRLLADHQETLSDAALSAAFDPHPWQRFQIGNAAAFGSDDAALRAALQQFHRYYHAGTIALWLTGPQSSEELGSLAQQFGEVFPAAGVTPPAIPALKLNPQGDIALQRPGAPRLRLSFLTNTRENVCLALLRQLLLDEAPGSLMAALRGQGLCDEVRLLLPYRSAQQDVIAIELVLVDATQDGEVEARVHYWLSQLSALTSTQRAHYMRLARDEFSRLPVMDRLREFAFGVAPALAEGNWPEFIAGLQNAPRSRLWVSEAPLAERRKVQGFLLACQVLSGAAVAPVASTEPLAFFPQPLLACAPVLPVQRVTLAHQRRDRNPAVLLISPEGDLPAPWGQILQACLRSLAAGCVHQGGELRISCTEGRWLIQLRGASALMLSTLASLNSLLRDLPHQAIAIAQGEREYQRQQQALRGDIPVRALLSALPERLMSSRYPAAGAEPQSLCWQALLDGGDNVLHQQLSHLLSAFPGTINSPVRALPELSPPQRHWVIASDSQESALLRFCPLVENSAQCMVAWQLLALIYQPLFFQSLRVEQNIGYVVSCRFYQAAGQSGILFALQSPHLSSAQLSEKIDQFLPQMNAVLAGLSADILWEKGQRLLAEQHRVTSDPMESSCQRWQLAQQNTPQPDASDLESLTPDRLMAYHLRLLADGQNAWYFYSSE